MFGHWPEEVSQRHRVTVFRHPHDVIFAVPNRVAAAFVQFHAAILHRKCTYPIPTKGVGFTDPLSWALKRFLATKPLTIAGYRQCAP